MSVITLPACACHPLRSLGNIPPLDFCSIIQGLFLENSQTGGADVPDVHTETRSTLTLMWTLKCGCLAENRPPGHRPLAARRSGLQHGCCSHFTLPVSPACNYPTPSVCKCSDLAGKDFPICPMLSPLQRRSPPPCWETSRPLVWDQLRNVRTEVADSFSSVLSCDQQDLAPQ